MGGTILLFGGRSGTGLEIARAARAGGFAVTAAVRPGADVAPLTEPGCQVVEADALDAVAVARAFDGFPQEGFVVSTLGGRAPDGGFIDDRGNRHVVEAAVAVGAAHLLLVSSLGAGDSRAHASDRLLAAIGDVLWAKTRAEEHLAASGLPFTILRPGGLVKGGPTGTGRLDPAPDRHGFLTRGELAALALGCLGDAGQFGRTLSAVDPLCPPPRRTA